ncbi:saccharopine dehydrogenase [Dictyocaulus viviparus]|uniref:Saccharopine dehydrogenase n=1 Tax=Dictyocaulus viviparus TaxID=29172 RepID=A0A0D8YC32_DICVI|nr:saccharopine dehydrogenase [Dictyocaulus viviparus]
MSRHDVVIYGATGFTGSYIVERLASSKLYEGYSFAVAGRNEMKLRRMLAAMSKKTGKDLNKTPVIVADSSNENSLVEMAKRAKVIINAVGPYRLYGEAVVKAAVENGASHVDISGEPAFLEKMQLLYGEKAKEKGVYVVGACGWDSIPCDLGINLFKEKFRGDLNHVEAFVQLNSGPSGYAINAGTYQTLILGVSEAANDGLGKIRKELMPEKIMKSYVKPPKRGLLWQINEKELCGWALPFLGSDKSIVYRSQYYDTVVNGKRPVQVETYLRNSSLLWTVLLALWLYIFQILVHYDFSRKILQKYPDLCSFSMFKGSECLHNSGPTADQIAEASFIYWFIGYGYSERKPLDEQHECLPNQRMVLACKGPDAGYMATSGCVLSAALALIHGENLPKNGGVYTTASAFAKTKIYSYLESFGIVFKVVTPQEPF